MKWITASVVAFVAGCVSFPAADIRVVQKVEHESFASLAQACGNGSPFLKGCYARTTDGCVMHTLKREDYGKDVRWWVVLGHELDHCFRGNFHMSMLDDDVGHARNVSQLRPPEW